MSQVLGYTLTPAANRHLTLAYPYRTCFEPIPFGPPDLGAIDVIRTDATGHVNTPEAPPRPPAFGRLQIQTGPEYTPSASGPPSIRVNSLLDKSFR